MKDADREAKSTIAYRPARAGSEHATRQVREPSSPVLSENVRHTSTGQPRSRAVAKSSRTFCVWITGLPAAGKSTVAAALRDELHRMGIASYILDGDQVREGLNRDLGFSAADRAESVRRVGEVARLMLDAGVVVIVSLISPFQKDRAAVQSRFEPGRFLEVFLDTPLDVCESRDPKGHYKRARVGEISEFTGINSPYERPHSPDVHLVHDGAPPLKGVARIVEYLEQRGLIDKC